MFSQYPTSKSFLLTNKQLDEANQDLSVPKLTRIPTRTFKMKHLAAYLLLGLGGNTSPSADDIKGVLSSVGVEADDERLEKLLSELEGKDINEVRANAQEYCF